MAVVLVYEAWAGPYLELPADPWRHVDRFVYAWQSCILSEHFQHIWIYGGFPSLTDYLVRQGGLHWYILHALLCKWSGLAVMELARPLSTANTIVFCLSIYWFAQLLWSRLRLVRRQKIQASLWTVSFTALWLGVSVFAYIRYYALAPTILNYVIYLAVVILMLDYLRSRYWWSHVLWLAPVLLVVLNINHTQEAAFTFFIGIGVLIVMEGLWLWTRFCRTRSDAPMLTFPVNKPKVHVLFMGGLIIYCLTLYYSLHKPFNGYSVFALKPLFQGVFLNQTWFIQPPGGQFFQVVTWWGLFVYALFLIYFRNFARQPFILAGMLMPFLIVFNPLTIAILLRWVPDVNAIYRFNYMIPLPFVAGFLAMRFSNDISQWVKTGWRKRVSSGIWQRGILASGGLLGLLLLLTPLDALLYGKTNSRFYTLKPVAEGNDHRQWNDLISFLREHPQVSVLTDPYTFWLLHWLNLYAIDGEWWIGPSQAGIDRLQLLHNLDLKRDWWLVVNRRNGNFSQNGFLSGHWPGDSLMRFASFYPEDFFLFIKQHPELFKEIWSQDQIRVYDIVESRL